MITQRVDAICLAPIDKTAMVSIVERAHRENIPVVIFDSPVDTPDFVAQVATDNYAAGVMAAGRMGKILNGKGKIAEVAVQPGAASTMAREQGFEDTVKKDFPGIKIVDKRYGWADRAKSLTIAENMNWVFLEKGGDPARDDSRVSACRILARPKDIEIAKPNRS